MCSTVVVRAKHGTKCSTTSTFTVSRPADRFARRHERISGKPTHSSAKGQRRTLCCYWADRALRTPDLRSVAVREPLERLAGLPKTSVGPCSALGVVRDVGRKLDLEHLERLPGSSGSRFHAGACEGDRLWVGILLRPGLDEVSLHGVGHHEVGGVAATCGVYSDAVPPRAGRVDPGRRTG